MESSRHTAEYYKEEIDALTKQEDIPPETILILMNSVKSVMNREGNATSEQIVKQFIVDLLEQDAQLKVSLDYLKIKNSEQIGRLILKLADLGAYVKEDGDSIEEFQGLFESSKISDYLKKEGLKNPKANIVKFSYLLFAASGICWVFWMTTYPSDYLVAIGCLIGLLAYTFYYQPHRVQNFLKRSS